MTSEQFESFWTSTYPETIPLSYYFKWVYDDRWFRIHSLPESKRYATDSNEWDILLTRQNEIISDLIGNSLKLYFVTGEYEFDGKFEEAGVLKNVLFKDFKFTSLKPIDLHKRSPEEYDDVTFHRPFVAEIEWGKNKFDEILKSIANDEMRAFFISVDKKCLIAPYDGGMDFVLENSEIRDKYKAKYKDWLSLHPEGL